MDTCYRSNNKTNYVANYVCGFAPNVCSISNTWLKEFRSGKIWDPELCSKPYGFLTYLDYLIRSIHFEIQQNDSEPISGHSALSHVNRKVLVGPVCTYWRLPWFQASALLFSVFIKKIWWLKSRERWMRIKEDWSVWRSLGPPPIKGSDVI